MTAGGAIKKSKGGKKKDQQSIFFEFTNEKLFNKIVDKKKSNYNVGPVPP